MPCLAAPQIPIPPLLSILLPSLAFDVSTPTLGVTLCCTIESIPSYSLTLPIGAIPGVAVALQPILTAIMSYIDQLNTLLDSLSINCPLDGS